MKSLGGMALIALSWAALLPNAGQPNYLIAAGLLAVGVILLAWGEWRDRPLRSVPLLAAAALATSGALYCATEWAFTLQHQIAAVGPLLAWTVKLCGGTATWNGHFLYWMMAGEPVEIAVSSEGLALGKAVTVLGTVLLLGHFTTRRMLAACGLTLGCILLRFLALCLLTNTYSFSRFDLASLSLFWDPLWVVLSFLPLTLVLARTGSGVLPSLRDARPWRAWPLFAAATVALLAVTLSFNTTLENPRILIDDYHSGFWESSLAPFDTNSYGPESAYTFSTARRYLSQFGSVNVNADQTLDKAALPNTDVLVLKTPDKRFSAPEREAILSFVAAGGGLVLIGDHTDLLGMSTFLNEFSSKISVTFEFDAVNAISHGHFHNSSPSIFPRDSAAQAFDPTLFMTSCSLNIAASNTVLLACRDAVAIRGTYSAPSFFSEAKVSLSNQYGRFPMCVAGNFGAGRILCIADSTLFSDFSIHMQNRDKTLLRMIAYAGAHEEIPAWARWIGYAVALLLLIYWLSAKQKFQARRAVMGFGLAGALLCTLLVHAACAPFGCSLPKMMNPLPTAYVVATNVAAMLPEGPVPAAVIPDAMGHYHGDPAIAFDAVYVGLQRRGYQTRIVARPPPTVAAQDLLVWINPTEAERAQADNSATLGAHVLVLAPGHADGVGVHSALFNKGNLVELSPSVRLSRAAMGTAVDKPSVATEAGYETLYRAIDSFAPLTPQSGQQTTYLSR